MPTAPVQQVSSDWVSGSSVSVSLTATSGNLLAVAVFLFAGNSSNTVTGFSDGINSYSIMNADSQLLFGANTIIITYYAKNITGGSLTLTQNFNDSSVTAAQIVVHEISGASLTSPLDRHILQSQSAPGTGTDAITSTSVTTDTNGEYIFGACFFFSDILSIGTGYTSGPTQSNVGFTEYLIQSNAGSIAATFTGQFGASVYRTTIATFRPVSTPSGNSYYAVAQQ